MTREETQAILKQLGTSFPQFADMVHGLRFPVETLRSYRDALEGVSFLLAKEVISDWSSGKAAAPAAYERDQTIAKLCREVRDRQIRQDRKEIAKQEVEIDKNEVAKRRANYRPSSGWLTRVFDRFRDKAEYLKKGEITHSEYLAFVDSIVQEEARRDETT